VKDYWLPTPLTCFPFTSPPVRHRVPSGFNWALLSLQPKLKACRVRSANKHNHKLNTGNLEVHTLTLYQHTAHKRISFTLFFPRNFAYLSSKHKFDLASNQDHR